MENRTTTEAPEADEKETGLEAISAREGGEISYIDGLMVAVPNEFGWRRLYDADGALIRRRNLFIAFLASAQRAHRRRRTQ